MIFLIVPELQGEPDDISKEKVRLAAKEVLNLSPVSQYTRYATRAMRMLSVYTRALFNLSQKYLINSVVCLLVKCFILQP